MSTQTEQSNGLTTEGLVSWWDLTVPDAETIRNFYMEVCGWLFEPLDMGHYDDYVMTLPRNGKAVAGICHLLGSNNYLPPVWIPYVEVSDLEVSIGNCLELGGITCGSIRQTGPTRYIVIKDPAGAYLALCSTIETGS